jgi:uncharacterized membrane protein
MGTFYKVVGSAIVTFAVALISAALMKVFGQPLIDQLPTGAWGMDRLREACEWLVSPTSVFWLAAAGTAVFIYWFARRASVTRATTVNVCLWLAAGIIAGGIVTLRRQVPLESVWADAALWLLVVSYVMPIVAAALWWTVPLLIERLRFRAHLRESVLPAPIVAPVNEGHTTV